MPASAEPPASSDLPLETFRVLVEESLTGVYLLQHDRLVYVNRRLAELFGYTVDEMLRLPSVLDVIAGDDRALVKEKLRQRVSGEIARLEYTVRGVRKDGHTMHLDVRSVRTVHRGEPAVMGSMVDITRRVRMEDALRNLSLIDDLTGLYNRRGFTTLAERHLSLARRKKRPLLLVFADLDGLKAINDTLGHTVGDRALIDVAGLLRRTYRSADIIARIGGDEFTVFPLEADEESGERLVARLMETTQAFVCEEQRPYRLSLSVGVGALDPSACESVQHLLEEADRKLYEHKRRQQ